MVKLRPQIEAMGAQVAVVTVSTPDEAVQFCAERAPGVPCFADPKAESHQAFGLSSGSLAQMMGPEVWMAGMRATVQGQVMGALKNERQMPGLFVIGADGRVCYAYYSRHAGDYPSERAILRAVAVATGAKVDD